jgi:hypothetical protein
MNMNRTQRLVPTIIAIFGLVLMGHATAASAKVTHHDAKALVREHLKHDGHHDIQRKGKYTASVEVKNGKIAAMHVKHSEKGDIHVTKYKTHRKMAQVSGAHMVYASFRSAQTQDMGTVYIGYSYVDDAGDEEIFWYPEEMIYDGDTGAVEYVPTN